MREDDLLGLEFWRKQRAMGVRGVTTAAKGGKGGSSWSSYWTQKFTGVPLAYANNPVTAIYHNVRSCVLVEGTYYMYEEEYDVPNKLWKIYLRTSSDGITWSARGSALLAAGADGTYDSGGQADPSVIYESAGVWKMWFDAVQKVGGETDNSTWTLGYATSADGLTWTKVGQVLEQGGVGEWDAYSVHQPCTILHDGTYYMFYSGSAESEAPLFVKNIGLATSADGINFTKQPSYVISHGGAGSFDSVYVRPSHPIYLYGKWYMWYWADDGNSPALNTGLAVSDDLITWTKLGIMLADVSSANAILKRVGTNPNDTLVKLWVVDYVAMTALDYYKITLPLGDRTQIDGYAPTLNSYTANSFAANYIYMIKHTVAEAFTASELRIYIRGAIKPGSGTIKMALYSNVEGKPSVLLGITDEKNWSAITSNSWVSFTLTSGVAVTAGDYWVAFWSTQNFTMTRVVGVDAWTNKNLAYGAFPNPIGTLATDPPADYTTDTIIADYTQKCWKKALEAEPSEVWFNSVAGTKVASPSLVVSEYDWAWRGGNLYVYSDIIPDADYIISYK